MENVQQIDTELPQRFADLGFEEGEWEMLIDGANRGYYEFDPDEIEQQYLDIAEVNPGLDQHDIALKVLELYPYQSPPEENGSIPMDIDIVEGGKRKKSKTKKTKKSKKSKKTKKTKKSKKSKKTKKSRKSRKSKTIKKK